MSLPALARSSVFDWAPTPLLAIVWRELLSTLRLRRYFVLLVTMALFQLVHMGYTLSYVARYSISPATAIGRVLTVQCGALLLVLFLVVPALAAVSLAAERRQETDDLLRTALFHPATLIGGKLVAVLVTFMIFHLALLPFGAYVYFFAGIELRSFFQSTVLLYTTAVAHVVVGMLLSQVFSSPNRAVFIAIVSVALIDSVPAGLHIGMTPTSASSTLPPPNTVLLLAQIAAGEANWSNCGQLALQQALGVLVVATICFGVALLARLCRGPGFRWGTGNQETRLTHPPIPNWGNPVFHREHRLTRLSRPGWALLAFLASFIGAAWFVPWSHRPSIGRWDALDGGTLLLYILIPLLVVERCGREMEPSLLIHLRMSLLRSNQVLLGMGLAIFVSVIPLIAGTIMGSFLPFLVSVLTPKASDLGPLPDATLLALKSLNLIPKVAFAITVSFMCAHYHNPRLIDMAVGLMGSYALIALGEVLVNGLIDTSAVHELKVFGMAFVAIGNLVILLILATVPACIALVHLDGVFQLQIEDDTVERLEGRNA